MNINPVVYGDRLFMGIGYFYRYHKVLGLINMEGSVRNEPGVPYLYCYPDNYYNISIQTVLFPRVI